LIRWGPPIIGTGRSSIQFDGGTPFDKGPATLQIPHAKGFGLENSWNSTPDIPETEPGISEHSSVPSCQNRWDTLQFFGSLATSDWALDKRSGHSSDSSQMPKKALA